MKFDVCSDDKRYLVFYPQQKLNYYFHQRVIIIIMQKEACQSVHE